MTGAIGHSLADVGVGASAAGLLPGGFSLPSGVAGGWGSFSLPLPPPRRLLSPLAAAALPWLEALWRQTGSLDYSQMQGGVLWLCLAAVLLEKGCGFVVLRDMLLRIVSAGAFLVEVVFPAVAAAVRLLLPFAAQLFALLVSVQGMGGQLPFCFCSGDPGPVQCV